MFGVLWATKTAAGGPTVRSLDPTVALSWSDGGYSPDAIKDSYGSTFGGSGNGRNSPYGTGQSQAAYDMAYKMNGKYHVNIDDQGAYL
mmetsp:Transcript_25150/g.51164  ORF Transcript_25150/g.51164 Transcript_25150/m.51164 type:complete len:88 (-) Transcript_25150:248-511(-)